VLWLATASNPELTDPDAQTRYAEIDEGLPPLHEPEPELVAGASFDAFYFDQMAERDDAVRLTIRRREGKPAPHPAPLENVILTRWPAANVDWNGDEVLL